MSVEKLKMHSEKSAELHLATCTCIDGSAAPEKAELLRTKSREACKRYPESHPRHRFCSVALRFVFVSFAFLINGNTAEQLLFYEYGMGTLYGQLLYMYLSGRVRGMSCSSQGWVELPPRTAPIFRLMMLDASPTNLR